MFRFIPIETEETIDWKFVGKLHPNFRKQFDFFCERYSLDNVLVNIPSLSNPLKQKNERVCRYCGLGYPEVSFNKIAHAIPELLGNKKIISDSECDNCNQIFSVYENDLAYSLGFLRSIFQINGKAGVPKFKSPDKTFVVKEGSLPGQDKPVMVFESNGKYVKNFKVDKHNKTLSILTHKQSYKPFNVFKILTKIGICSAKAYDVPKFKKAIDLLINQTDIETSPNSVFQAFCHSIPGFTFPSPMVLLFKKKNTEESLFTYTACIYFMNLIYQVFLVGHEDDLKMYDGQTKISFPIAPPFVDQSVFDTFGLPSFYPIDLSSKELLKGENANVVLSFDSHKIFKGDVPKQQS